MNNILIHYGVKGMKWGVRKEYEGTDGGGGGGWAPNTVAVGGGPSPLAASMAGNPKKKKSVGFAEAKKMGIQDRVAKKLKKDPSKVGDEIEKHGDAQKLKDIKDKHKVMTEAVTNAAQDFAKQDAYDEDYHNKALEWAAEEVKKNPEVYKQIVKDAKDGGFDIMDHKIVQSYSDEYPEPYDPPQTDKTRAAHKAITDYMDACHDFTRDLLGNHGGEVVDPSQRRYNGAYGDTLGRHVARYLDGHSK